MIRMKLIRSGWRLAIWAVLILSAIVTPIAENSVIEAAVKLFRKRS